MIRAAALALAALALAGCSSATTEGARRALAVTGEKLGTIESGTLTMSFSVDPDGDADEFGWELHGPFALGDEPEADVEYTQRAQGEEATARLVLADGRGWVVDGERVTPLTAEQLEAVQGSLVAGGGVSDLDIGGWFRDAKRSDGPDGTERIEGELNVAAALTSLAELAASLTGAEAPAIEDVDAERLRRATEGSSFEVLTGKDDRLLRKLELEIDLGLDVPEELRDSFGDVEGATLRFLLEIDDPNEPVDVSPPAGA